MAEPTGLRYPLSELNKGDDFIKFTPFEYKRAQSEIGGDINFGNIKQIKNKEGNEVFGDKKGTDKLKSSFIGRKPYEAKTSDSSIILPIPSQLSDVNKVNYGQSNLNDFMAMAAEAAFGTISAKDPAQAFNTLRGQVGSVATIMGSDPIKKLAQIYATTQALSAIGGNISLDQLLARGTGSIINPNMELLFSGPALRQFKFQFKFSPREERESEVVRNIIKEFKKNMHPSTSNSSFLKTPNVFKIDYEGACKKWLNQYKTCALTDMAVNYTGEGTYAAYDSGAPVSVIMDLTFNELDPIYAEDYESVNGVGY